MATASTQDSGYRSERVSACIAAARALAEFKSKKFKPIPSECFTLEQYQKANGLKETAARNSLNELIKIGWLEARTWPHVSSRGRTFHKTIYKPVCNTKDK